MEYTELQVTSNFTFLRGGSHPEEIVERAAELGYKKIAITDRNTLAGIVRAHATARAKGISIIPACRLDLIDGPSLLAYPTTKAGYANLSGLLTTGNLRTEKGSCELYREDVYGNAGDIRFIAVPPERLTASFELPLSFKVAVGEYRQALDSHLYLGAVCAYRGDDGKKLFRLSQLAENLGMGMVAMNDVHYHDPSRRELQDILTCIREKCTIQTAGFHLHQNAERYLKPQAEMQRLFRRYPDAIALAAEIAQACTFSLDELRYVYPTEITTQGRSPMEELTMLTWTGAHDIYGPILPEKITAAIIHEMKFIQEMDYAPYFLTVHDIVRFARERRILCQGRGSAANSTVCFCLGITSVDPTKFELLFERFISSARNEPPDIDVDFEHERREEVMQYIYNKYGRDRAAIVATVTQVHWKGAVRDVAKAMGLSADTVDRLAKSGHELSPEWALGRQPSSEGFSPQDPHLVKVLSLTHQYIGFPRQLGQHTGGFVITDGKLSDLCPILNARMEDRTNIEWNKDDIDALGFLKIDVLALGMLTCVRKAFDLTDAHYGQKHTLANIPQDDPAVYEMVSHADTLGVFQIESRAQMSMLPRLRPKNFYDLVIEVALVRPGPIQGDMVHPYLRRRNGEEEITYPSKELEDILGRTLGVPLFQEQAMKIAIVAASFTPAEADGLRRSMATFKAKGLVSQWEKKLIDGMVANGYKLEFAQRVFKQLEGFGSYGFPESHAASFALLVYVSSWIKCYYPDVFATALLNSMPMGFYQPAQIVIDARKHGVEVLPVDINHSLYDNRLEPRAGRYHPLRLGFRQVKGLRQEDIDLLVSARGKGYTNIHALRDAGVSVATLERLADADAFRSIGLDRRRALWEVSALADRPIALFQGQSADAPNESAIQLPAMSQAEHVLQDYGTTALSLKAHPVGFAREKLLMLNIRNIDRLPQMDNGVMVKVAGLILVRQRPGTAGGVCFITIEDETGFANLVVFEKVFKKFRREIMFAKLLMVEGRLQREGEVTHVIVRRCVDLTHLLYPEQADRAENVQVKKTGPPKNKGNTAQTELFPSGRNFK